MEYGKKFELKNRKESESKMREEKLLKEAKERLPKLIRKINKKYRKIDKATDVLSFPMFEKDELDEKIKI